MIKAYTERYPEHVERLVLLSPVGVPDEEENNQQQKQWQERMNSSYRTRAMVGVFRTMFKTTTPGSVLRTLSESRARGMIEGYVERRLPEISDPAEQAAVSDYLYKSAVLPGSAEYCISKFLDPTILARKPLRNRIPLLKVPHVNFLYGSTDW
jgi:cardiolipin-specific phospholipase